MQDKNLEKRKELLKIVDSLPEDKLKDLKLIISGYVSCYESMTQTKDSA